MNVMTSIVPVPPPVPIALPNKFCDEQSCGQVSGVSPSPHILFPQLQLSGAYDSSSCIFCPIN